MIGITGQIGAGKSFIGEQLRKKGLKVLDADKAVHKLYCTDNHLRSFIKETFGEAALTKTGVDRNFLADIIFRDEQKRTLLESFLYPILIDFICKENPDYVEVALLEKTPELIKKLDEIWVVTAPEQTRMKRLVEKRQMTTEDALRRIKAQTGKDTNEDWIRLFEGCKIKFIPND